MASVRPPNGECYICTSPKHVAIDCPHRGRWLALRSVNLIHVDMDAADEANEMCEYLAMIAESNIYAYPSEDPEDERSAFVIDALGTGAKAIYLDPPHHRNRRRREAFEKAKDRPQEKGKGKAVECDDPVSIPRRQIRKAARVAELPSSRTEEGVEIFKAPKVQQLPDGPGSLGARALHVKLRVHSLDGVEIRGRLDSGADITHMSEECWESIPGLPKPKEGIHMKLYHLTGQAKVLGYIKTIIYLLTKTGEVVSFELEAYVVRNMRVPLLLGEDFQSSYELGVQ